MFPTQTSCFLSLDRKAKARPRAGQGPVRGGVPLRQLGGALPLRVKVGGAARRQTLERPGLGVSLHQVRRLLGEGCFSHQTQVDWERRCVQLSLPVHVKSTFRESQALSWPPTSSLTVSTCRPCGAVTPHLCESSCSLWSRTLPKHERLVDLHGSVIDHTYAGGSSIAVLLIMERLHRDLYTGLKVS